MKKSLVIKLILSSVATALLTTLLVLGIVVPKYVMPYKFDITGFENLKTIPVTASFSYLYEDEDKFTIGADEVSAEKIKKLDISWISGSVKIVPYDGNTIKLEEDEGFGEDFRLRYRVKGNTLIIKACRSMFANFTGSLDAYHKKLTVYLPKSLAEDFSEIHYESIDSDIELDEITVNSVFSKLVACSILMKNTKCDNLKAQSTSGSIKLENVIAENAECRATTGSIEISGNIEKLETSSSSADISVTLQNMPQKLNTKNTTGATTVTIPGNGGFEVSVKKANGEFKSDFPMKSKDDKYTYGDGKYHYKAETTSGNIYFKISK